ncbi:MAG: EMC3/TMCO1 family protein [archaeon]
MALTIPIISFWIDMILISVLFSILNRFIQHITGDTKLYFYIKKRNKEINIEVKELIKQNQIEKVNERQNEMMKLAGKQFSGNLKPMIFMMFLALPLLWFVNTHYKAHIYIWNINGFWMYVILSFIASIALNIIYDKMFENKIDLSNYILKD